eukprot:PITA_28968
MAEDGRFRVEKFNGQNYQLWKMQMEDYLYQRDLYVPLSGKTKKLTSMIDTEWNILNKRVLGTIWLCLAALVAFSISKEMTTEGLMSTLAKLYEKPSASNKVFLMKRLINMRKSEGGSIADHLKDFNTVKSQLSSVGTLKFDDVVGAILSKEMQQKSSGETLGNALTAETRGREMERGKSPGYHSKSRKGRSKSRSGKVCWKCGKKGYLKKDCKSQKGKEGDV